MTTEFSLGLGKRSEALLRELQQELDDGRFQAGVQYFTELELCERFGASRNTVRRALARLVADDRLEVRRPYGVFVRPQARPAGAASRTISVMYPFAADSLLEVQHHLLIRDYLLCVYAHPPTERWIPAQERIFLQRVYAERHFGLLAICTPASPRNDDLLQQITNSGTRIIHLEPYTIVPPVQPYLFPDYRRAGYLAATTLLLAGYPHLVYTGLDNDWPSAQLCHRGFADAMDDHCGGYDPARHYFAHLPHIERDSDAQQHLHAFMDTLSRGTGVVCRSDVIAAYLTDCLRTRGWQVPGDARILTVTWSGMPIAEGIETVDFDRRTLLMRALDLLTADESPTIRELGAPTFRRHEELPATKDDFP